jgi:hypothetical protein
MKAQELYIRCPATGLLVHTGLSMLPEAFEHAKSIFKFSSLQCPLCGEVHKFDKADLVIAQGAQA